MSYEADEHIGPELLEATRQRAALFDDGDNLIDDTNLARAFARSVHAARYWESPDITDVLASDIKVIECLFPVADKIARSPEREWWNAGIARHSQVVVERLGTGHAPQDAGDSEKLIRASTTAPGVPKCDNVGGHDQGHSDCTTTAWRNEAAYEANLWWSCPDPELDTTTRNWNDLGPVELYATEDDEPAEGELALSWSVDIAPSVRILELTSESLWIDLVDGYPKDVTESRGRAWSRATGESGRWLMPDWGSVAADFDAIHLPVGAYLALSGRPIRVARGYAFLSGWVADGTVWLRDSLRRGYREQRRYERSAEMWHRTAYP